LNSRIYRPGAPALVNAQPELAAAPSEAAAGIAGHPDDDQDLKQQPFPAHALPPTARAMAVSIARTERTPESLAGCCCLGIISASIGAGLRVQSGANRFTRANIFLLVSAASGSGKSETFRHAAKPFHDLEHKMLENWQSNDAPRLESEKAMLLEEVAHLQKKARGESSPVEREEIRAGIQGKKQELLAVEALLCPPILSVEDTTSEKLAVMLANRGEQLASLSADAGAIVNNLLGRYNKLDRTDEGIYLKAYSGDRCRVDRLGRPPVNLKSPCLSALWLTQPDKVETLLGERGLTEGGMIARLLVCHSHARPQRIDGVQRGIGEDVGGQWAGLVDTLIQTFRLAPEPVTIQPTTEALGALTDFHNSLVDRQNSDLMDVNSYVMRWSEQCWRIAVCLHAGAHGANAGHRPIELETARDAITLAGWFAGEQLQILSAGRRAGRQSLRDQVLGLVVQSPAGITARDCMRARIKTTAGEAHDLLSGMESDGVLEGRDAMPEKGGTISRTYTKARR